MNFIKVLVSIIAVYPTLAASAIVTQNYTSTISVTSNVTSVSIGDTFDWSVTYDDEALFMTEYNVVDNSSNIICIDPYVGDCSGGSFESTEYGFLSDAVFTGLDDYLSSVEFAADGSVFAGNSHDELRSWAYDDLEGLKMLLQSDYYHFQLNYTTFNIKDATGLDGIARIEYTTEISAVPLPAAVWLFGSGLLGLIGVARRKA